MELAESQEHFKSVCQSMIREALAIMELDKEEEGEQELCYQQDDTVSQK